MSESKLRDLSMKYDDKNNTNKSEFDGVEK